MVVLWGNVNTPAGPMNMLTEYARHDFNTPLVFGHVVVYILVFLKRLSQWGDL